MVELKNNYLQISPEIFENCLTSCENIFYVYYPAHSKLMIAPVNEEFFKEIHKCQSTFLKIKNKEGVRAFQIANLLLDNNLDEYDRPLAFEVNHISHILTVTL